MRRFSARDIVLKALGLLLVAAALLKGHELLIVPVAHENLWSWRPFLIFQTECELALGIWLVSGVFKRLAWLAASACFSLFCCLTLYKGLTGAASCGCFGTVHVHPWITLLAVDLPAVVALAAFRPKLEKQRILHIQLWLEPRPRLAVLIAVFLIGISTVGVSSPLLFLHEPPVVTTQYEVLEPETWVGKPLPILGHIDVADQLKAGKWLILLVRANCHTCLKRIPEFRTLAQTMKNNFDTTQIAMIQVPPIEGNLKSSDLEFVDVLGQLDRSKLWFVRTPSEIRTTDGVVEVANGISAPVQGDKKDMITTSPTAITLNEVDPMFLEQEQVRITNTSALTVELSAHTSGACAEVGLVSSVLSPRESTVLNILFVAGRGGTQEHKGRELIRVTARSGEFFDTRDILLEYQTQRLLRLVSDPVLDVGTYPMTEKKLSLLLYEPQHWDFSRARHRIVKSNHIAIHAIQEREGTYQDICLEISPEPGCRKMADYAIIEASFKAAKKTILLPIAMRVWDSGSSISPTNVMLYGVSTEKWVPARVSVTGLDRKQSKVTAITNSHFLIRPIRGFDTYAVDHSLEFEVRLKEKEAFRRNVSSAMLTLEKEGKEVELEFAIDYKPFQESSVTTNEAKEQKGKDPL